MPYSILLTGTYNSMNKGDAAMQLATHAALQQRLGDTAQVTICTPFPEIDRPFYGPVMLAMDDRRQLVRGTVRLLGGALSRRFAAADLVVDLSGDMLTEDYGPHVAWSHFLPLLRAARAGTPYMICAQSIGPFRHTLPIARRIINGAAAVTVRDAISADYLRAIGIAPDKIVQTADMAFLLPTALRDASLDLIRHCGLDPQRPIVAVSLSRLVARRYDARMGQGAFVALMQAELARLVAEYGVQLLFVAHVTGPAASKDDRVIAREVLAGLDQQSCALLDRDARPEQLKGVIACCTATIGCRMHANIASLSSTVPVLAISYSHKTPGIMQACGLGEMVLDVDHFDPADLRSAIARLLDQREALAAQMAQPVQAQKAAAMGNIDIIVQQLALAKA